ncbi:hypothetical protein PHLCEN_2v8104 [Hermanssonia centrifuga]|uniref:Uncharacterized protein n=1 Tax=Hermanssonia centrifuga TaxID=98765 RepID=A0A2R6NUM4_9APHY|nr:hypothetical protein PHLCEN_2v8104 [Hermanssonia centrifuga]
MEWHFVNGGGKSDDKAHSCACLPKTPVKEGVYRRVLRAGRVGDDAFDPLAIVVDECLPRGEACCQEIELLEGANEVEDDCGINVLVLLDGEGEVCDIVGEVPLEVGGDQDHRSRLCHSVGKVQLPFGRPAGFK